MYKLTLILFTFLSLAFALPQPKLDKIGGPKKWITGEATWYHTGLGNCGKTNYDNQLVVAISEEIYDNGTHCEKYVRIKYGSEKSVTAKIVDSCPGCDPDCLDMSPATFKSLAPLSKGVIEIEWEFM